jgi:hypothetical protein
MKSQTPTRRVSWPGSLKIRDGLNVVPLNPVTKYMCANLDRQEADLKEWTVTPLVLLFRNVSGRAAADKIEGNDCLYVSEEVWCQSGPVGKSSSSQGQS